MTKPSKLGHITVEARRQHDRNPQIAGMLRALANSIGGFRAVADCSDEQFCETGRFTFQFADSLAHPGLFVLYVNYYLWIWVRVVEDDRDTEHKKPYLRSVLFGFDDEDSAATEMARIRLALECGRIVEDYRIVSYVRD